MREEWKDEDGQEDSRRSLVFLCIIQFPDCLH
jgi:hypothetical protein